jgi:hypothetical protein
VQYGAVPHTDPGMPLMIGKGVTIRHNATVHGCDVADFSLAELIGRAPEVLLHHQLTRSAGMNDGASCFVRPPGQNGHLLHKKNHLFWPLEIDLLGSQSIILMMA